MYKRILVPIDGSDTAARALQEAVSLARDQGAKLYLLHIAGDFRMRVEITVATNFDEVRNALRRNGEELLAKAKARAVSGGASVDTVLRETVDSRVADTIVGEVQRSQCDLIVMGTHGRRGFDHLVMGSDAEIVIRTSPVPVLVVREPQALASA